MASKKSAAIKADEWARYHVLSGWCIDDLHSGDIGGCAGTFTMGTCSCTCHPSAVK